MPEENPKKETIKIDDVFGKNAVEDIDIYRTRASIWLAWAALLIGVGALAGSAYFDQPALQTWATGLISAVAGAAISYGFASKQ